MPQMLFNLPRFAPGGRLKRFEPRVAFVPNGPLGLREILDELDRSAIALQSTLKSGLLDQARGDIDALLSAIRTANQLLPDDLKRPRGAFRQLQQHGRFVDLYCERDDIRYVRSNASALRTDLVRLRAECAPRLSDDDPDIPINVEELPASPAKTFLREGVANLRVGARNSAIVSAVNALERYLRELRSRRMGIETNRGRLVDVIEELQSGAHLSSSEAPLLHVLRLYRNASAHPSEFVATGDDAKMVIQFVFSRLKMP